MNFITNIDTVDALKRTPYYSRTLMKDISIVPLILVAMWMQASAFAQTTELKLETGEDIYKAACIGCHGPNGKGQPETTLGFEKPPQFPDFSDCNGTTREKVFDWTATIHEGGPKRGWSEIMPSYSEALTLDQIQKVTDYLRSLCDDHDRRDQGESDAVMGHTGADRVRHAALLGAAQRIGQRRRSGSRRRAGLLPRGRHGPRRRQPHADGHRTRDSELP